MKSKNRSKLTRPTKQVGVELVSGAGRWLLLFCEAGHSQQCFPYGEWSAARKKYGRKNATVDCGSCAKEDAND